MITIENAKPTQAYDIASLIMVAMTDDCCLNFCGEGKSLDDFRHMMTLLVERDDSQYSWRNTIVALDGDVVVGIATAYDGGDLHRLRQPFIELAKIHLNRDHTHIADETQAGELYLDSLAVLPQYRHRGIATGLINATAHRAATMKLPQVGLLVDTQNPGGEAFYTRCGFTFANRDTWGGHEMKHLVKPVNPAT